MILYTNTYFCSAVATKTSCLSLKPTAKNRRSGVVVIYYYTSYSKRKPEQFFFLFYYLACINFSILPLFEFLLCYICWLDVGTVHFLNLPSKTTATLSQTFFISKLTHWRWVWTKFWRTPFPVHNTDWGWFFCIFFFFFSCGENLFASYNENSNQHVPFCISHAIWVIINCI